MNLQKSNIEGTYKSNKYDYLEKYISYYHEIKLVTEYNPKSVLECGCGNNTLKVLLKNKNIMVKSLDYDELLEPDIVGDLCYPLPFDNCSFDMVVCFETLEHLPFSYFEMVLKEFYRVSRGLVIISVPFSTFNIYIKSRFLPFVKPIVISCYVSLDLLNTKSNDNEHYWEMGRKHYPKKLIRKVIKRVGFSIEKEFFPEIEGFDYFFILKKMIRRKKK